MRIPRHIFTALLLATPLVAADSYNWESSVQFNYSQVDRLPQHAFRGWTFGTNWTQTPWLRWSGEVGSQTGRSDFHVLEPIGLGLPDRDWHMDQVVWQFYLGPEFTKRTGRLTLFAHVLPGFGIWELYKGEGAFQYKTGVRESGFSMAIGGGVDVQVWRRLKIRLAQVDYVPVWLGAGNPSTNLTPSLPPPSGPYSATRLGTGLVWMWKGR